MIGQTNYKNGKPFFENDPDLDDPTILNEILGKALPWETLEKHKQDLGPALYHAPYNPKPYAGWAKKLHDNGKDALLGAFKNGKPSGLWTWWDENGMKEDEKRY